MKNRKTSYVMIAACVYVLLFVAILISVSVAKYTDGRKVYTDFGAADFNAAIILTDPAGGESSQSVNLSVRPGMVDDESLRIPFYVGNGSKMSNSSGGDIRYTVRLRTGQNIKPLEYSLCHRVTEEDGSVTEYYYDTLEYKQITDSTEGAKIWEYTFTLRSDSGNTDPQPETAELNTGGNGAEAEFILDSNGQFAYEEYNLMIHWPVAHTKSLDSMKEVEIINIVVNATSVNKNDDDSYIRPGEIPEPEPEEAYTPGLVILNDRDRVQRYAIDLRAFTGDHVSRSFTVYADNGVDYQKSLSYGELNYKLFMKVPTSKTVDETTGAVTVEPLDLNVKVDGQASSLLYYYIVNEKTDEVVGYSEENSDWQYESIEALMGAHELQEEERIYGLYSVGNYNSLTNYAPDSMGNLILTADRNTHEVTISGDDLVNITDASLSDYYSFSNKLEMYFAIDYDNMDPVGGSGS